MKTGSFSAGPPQYREAHNGALDPLQFKPQTISAEMLALLNGFMTENTIDRRNVLQFARNALICNTLKNDLLHPSVCND
jgi:hypothetical protein